MMQIFYAWELGANLGHVGAFMPLAKALRARGHSVHCALTKPVDAMGLLLQDGFNWLQAPGLPDQRPGHDPENYSAILLHHGYAHANKLLALVVAWRELMRLSQCQVVLADHAPTAILAARTLGLPVMLFGNGFCVPPALPVCPAMRAWREVPAGLLEEIDGVALGNINRVLQHFGQAPLQAVAELFDVAESGLLTFPELDHYPRNRPIRYWGSLTTHSGIAPSWPEGSGAKVFVYARPTSPHFEKLTQALSALHARVWVFAPGLAPDAPTLHQNPSIMFSDQPAHLEKAAQEADLGVLLGGGGVTTATFLRAGTPVLLLPDILEPYLQGLKVQALGAGLVCDLAQQPDALPRLFEQLLAQASFNQNAQAFAARHAAHSQDQTLVDMCLRLEEMV